MLAAPLMHNPCTMGLEFDDLQMLLAHSRALAEAAEAHGTLAGALCAASDFSLEDWLVELYAEGRTDEATLEALRAVFETTRGELASDQMEFRALLPGDETPIGERAEALGHWCQGFLYGLSTRPLPAPEQLSQDAGEVVRDLTAMTQVMADAEASEESNEEAYAELVEFVRVAAQLLFDEFERWRGAAPAGPSPAGALH
jgi:hypothetical protein